MEKNSLLRVAQAASVLGVDTSTVRRWDRQGILPSVRTGGQHRRFKLADVLNFQQKRRAALAKGRQLAEAAFRLAAKGGC